MTEWPLILHKWCSPSFKNGVCQVQPSFNVSCRLFVAEIVEPYFCLYSGTNLLEMFVDNTIDLTGYCNAFYSGEMQKRQSLFDLVYQGNDCVTSVTNI